jgi:hypothetical protein
MKARSPPPTGSPSRASPFELARIEIVRGDTLRDFALKVAAH